MRNQILAAAVAAAVAVPFAVPASPSHSFAEINYRNVDGDLDGYGAKASFAMAPQWHLYGEFSRVTDSPIRADTGLAAIGFHHAMAPNTDLVLRGGWTQVRDRTTLTDNGIDVDLGTFRESGFAAQAGLRSMVTPNIELNGFVKHVDVFGGDTSVAIGGVFGFTPQFGLTGGVEFGDDDTIYEVGLRASFGAPRAVRRR